MENRENPTNDKSEEPSAGETGESDIVKRWKKMREGTGLDTAGTTRKEAGSLRVEGGKDDLSGGEVTREK